MPDAPASSPAKTVPAAPDPSKTAARNSGDVKTDAPVPVPARSSRLVIGLGALSGILFILVLALWFKVSVQGTTLVENRNRIAQFGSATEAMQAQVDGAKADSAKLQTQVDDAEARAAALNSQLDKVKAGMAELQTQLDKTRAIANGFQSKMEEANVASIRHQGEVEIAKAQATVLQTQLNEAKADIARLQAQLEESRANSTALQAKLAAAEKELALLRKGRP